MSNLPLFKINDTQLTLWQTRWKSQLDVLLSNVLTGGVLLTNVSLVAGNNVINHTLGRMQRGWFVVDQTGASAVFRAQPFNTTTLTLSASAPVTISLWCF